MAKNVFYFHHLNVIGGVENMFYELGKKYKDWDIVVYYGSGDKKQIESANKRCEELGIEEFKKQNIIEVYIKTGEFNSIDKQVCANKVNAYIHSLLPNLRVCYTLATPTTINTPATPISLNKGNNTLTADGDMELIYSKTPQ